MKGGFHLLDSKYELFLDTNALLNLGNNAFKENFIISQKTLEEIENIKSSSNKDGEVKWKARNISRLLDVNYGNYTVIPNGSEITKIISDFELPSDRPDNIIIASAYYYNNHNHQVIVCSDDLNCKFISRNIFRLPTKGIDEINLVKNIEEYKGYKDVTLSDDEMSNFYSLINSSFQVVKVSGDQIAEIGVHLTESEAVPS